MSRQYFQDTLAEPPIANLTAVTATSETILWNVSNYSPIAASDARPGKAYRMTAGGIYTLATTGTLIITPRFGLTVAAGITMGANAAITVPSTAVTNGAWHMEFTAICRTVGAPGTNSTVMGTGFFYGAMDGVANHAFMIAFGGTSASVDVSIATGICIGWTLSVAGSITPQWVVMQSLN